MERLFQRFELMYTHRPRAVYDEEVRAGITIIWHLAQQILRRMR